VAESLKHSAVGSYIANIERLRRALIAYYRALGLNAESDTIAILEHDSIVALGERVGAQTIE
jgi:hypothetical protein